MSKLSILLTGGLGQVGSYLYEALRLEGHDVVILDNLSTPNRRFSVYAPYIRGDIRDRGLVESLVMNSDAVIHCAAQVYVSKSMNDPAFDADNNIMGTLNLLEACRHVDVRRFIYFSSAAVYGEPVGVPIGESHPAQPISPYGISKLSGEKYALAYQRIYGIPATVIRPFNIYSPRQDPSSPYSGVISRFIERVRGGMQPVIFGDGTATRDFVSVHDVVSMVSLMLKCEASVGKAFNCGTGVATSIYRLASEVTTVFGKDFSPEYSTARAGDIVESVSDIALAKKALGYHPRITLKEGLIEMAAGQAGREQFLESRLKEIFTT